MHLAENEAAATVLSEAEVPHAPVHHVQTAALQVHHHFGRGVVADVHPQASLQRQQFHARVEPVEGEAFIRVARHAIAPAFVGHFPVEGRIREHEISLPLIGEAREDVTAVADVHARVRIVALEVGLRQRVGCRMSRHAVAHHADVGIGQLIGSAAHGGDATRGHLVATMALESGCALSFGHQAPTVPKMRSPASPRPGRM